jgi:hypothetical protein
MLVPRIVIDEAGPSTRTSSCTGRTPTGAAASPTPGFQTWVVPKARVVHDEGGTRGPRLAVPVVYHFHRGAYIYWRNHHAPEPWNPTRWAAAGALAARGDRHRRPATGSAPASSPAEARVDDGAQTPPQVSSLTSRVPCRTGEAVTTKLFFKRYWRVPVVALLGALIAFGGSFMLEETYTSTTRVLIRGLDANLTTTPGAPTQATGQVDATGARSFAETQAGWRRVARWPSAS